MLNSLRARLLLLTLLTAVLSSGLVALFASASAIVEFNRYVDAEQTALDDRIGELLLVHYSTAQSWEGVEPLVEQLAALTGRQITLLDINGMAIAHSAAGSQQNVSQRVRPTLPAGIVLPGSSDLSQDLFAPDNPLDALLAGRRDEYLPLEVDGKAIGNYLIVPVTTVEMVPMQTDFNTSINVSLLLSAGIAGTLAVLLASVLSRSILRPVDALITAAADLGSGNLSRRVPVRGMGQIGQLARAFNAMANALSQNETLRRNMVSDIAHELRTPVTNLRGYLEAMQDGLLRPDTEQLGLLHEEVLLLNDLIADLQDLALAEAGQLTLEPVALPLADAVAQSVSIMQGTAAAKGITLRAELPDTLPEVHADRQRTVQILRNLLTNAIKYMPEGGEIVVTAQVEAAQVQVAVRDTGIGIPADKLPYVFERFYRVDSARGRDTGGAGLGLAIVRQLVQNQGGSVRVTSEAGKGSTFSFTLPVAA